MKVSLLRVTYYYGFLYYVHSCGTVVYLIAKAICHCLRGKDFFKMTMEKVG